MRREREEEETTRPDDLRANSKSGFDRAEELC